MEIKHGQDRLWKESKLFLQTFLEEIIGKNHWSRILAQDDPWRNYMVSLSSYLGTIISSCKGPNEYI